MTKVRCSDDFKRDAVRRSRSGDTLSERFRSVLGSARIRCTRGRSGSPQSPRITARCRPSIAADNTLDRQFDVAAPDKAWVADITYIKTLEGFAYLAVVIDLYSRRIIGWSMQSRQTMDIVLQALLMAGGAASRNPRC